MEPLSVEESQIVRACLGSRDPFDRIWGASNTIAAVSDRLICIINDIDGWTGGVLGTALTDFFRLSEGEAVITPVSDQALTLVRGPVKLTLALSPPECFSWPSQHAVVTDKSLVVDNECLDEMLAAASANKGSELQVVRFEMLGFAIHQGAGYSLSLDSLILMTRQFATQHSLLLPTPFLVLLHHLRKNYAAEAENVVIGYDDRMVWARVGRTYLAAAVPAIASWMDLALVTAKLEKCPQINVDLSSLSRDLTLLQSLSPTILLSKAGVRCGTTHAWYESDSVASLPEDCLLSTEKLASVLTLTPQLVQVAPQLVKLQGPKFEAYMATAVAVAR